MRCKNVKKTTFTFYTVQEKMHTQSFTIPQFPKIGLTHKKTVPSGVANCCNLPFCGQARRGSRVRLPKEENARSRHQRLFVENVRKTEGNRSWRIFQIRELYLRLRKLLASLTFVPKDNSLSLGLCEMMYLNLLFLFIFLRSTKAGLLLLRTPHRRRNQTYVVLSKGEIKRFFLLWRRSF